MTNLIKVGETINSMTSLQIAELTGKRHADVLRDIRSLLGQGINECNFALVDYADAKGEKRPMFQVTKKGCLILASGYDALLREKIINRWEELETKELQKFQIPQTLSQALMLAAQQAEQIEQQQALLLEQAPKVEFYDEVTESADTCDMAKVAKVLDMGIGRNNLFELLRNEGVLRQNNEPYQKYIDNCWLRVVESRWQNNNGETRISFKTVVFQKGIDGIRKIIQSKKQNGKL